MSALGLWKVKSNILRMRLTECICESKCSKGRRQRTARSPPRRSHLKGLKKTTSLRLASGQKLGGQVRYWGKTLKRADNPNIVHQARAARAL